MFINSDILFNGTSIKLHKNVSDIIKNKKQHLNLHQHVSVLTFFLLGEGLTSSSLILSKVASLSRSLSNVAASNVGSSCNVIDILNEDISKIRFVVSKTYIHSFDEIFNFIDCFLEASRFARVYQFCFVFFIWHDVGLFYVCTKRKKTISRRFHISIIHNFPYVDTTISSRKTQDVGYVTHHSAL